MTKPSGTTPGLAELRTFGLLFGVILIILFGLLIPFFRESLWQAKWPWITGLSVILVALFRSGWLAPLYRIWMKFGQVMGWVNTRIILGAIFFGLLLPVGLVMRLLQKDPLRRKLDKQLTTYRVIEVQPPKEQMEKPY